MDNALSFTRTLVSRAFTQLLSQLRQPGEGLYLLLQFQLHCYISKMASGFHGDLQDHPDWMPPPHLVTESASHSHLDQQTLWKHLSGCHLEFVVHASHNLSTVTMFVLLVAKVWCLLIRNLLIRKRKNGEKTEKKGALCSSRAC